ncbi:sensor histidine kinase [Microbispora sp. NPDC049125]|uniref:sensor histidine kinase n=1 Tax=Microbispora sp. NPDC049125 TaxID=3154929 RepID=UPI003467B6F0
MSSVRARLTLLYVALFTVCGAVVVTITYGMVAGLPPSSGETGVRPADSPARCQDMGHTAGLACDRPYQEGLAAGAESQRQLTLDNLLQYSTLTLLATIALSAAAGWLVASRALRPVEAAHAAQRRFVANAAHELRTPLTVMRTAVDVVLAKRAPTNGELTGMGHEVAAAVQQAEGLIDGLLTLARTERPPAREEVDLATIAEDVIDAAGQAVHTRLEVAPTLGDPVTLERLVANLVENAIRHNIPGGEVWVETGRLNGRAVLMVGNTGPVIDPEAVPGLFEPFRRSAERTGVAGHGLGLAIVAQIVAAHNGTVIALARQEGGLTVTVTLPG